MVSIPRANPETIVQPHLAAAAESSRAVLSPYAVVKREPTMASVRALSCNEDAEEDGNPAEDEPGPEEDVSFAAARGISEV